MPNRTLALQIAPACLFSYCTFGLSYVHRTGCTVVALACLHYSPFLMTLMLAETFWAPSPAFPMALLTFALCSYSIYNDFSRLLNHDCQILLNLPISHDDEVSNRFV